MKIQHKRSNVLDGGKAKEPTAAQMEYGELAVNYNTTDPAVFIKDSSDNIVKIADAVPAGDGTITIKQPGSPDQSFTVNQAGNTEINLKNDNTQVTPGNGALSIESFGSGDASTGSYTANQAGAGTVTLPQISYTDLKDKPSIPTPGAGVITIKQPGTDDQSFNVNQSGPTEINLKNDNTVVTPGAGVITIKQPGVSDQSFNVNQAGPTEINLKNDNTIVTPGDGELSIKTFGSEDISTGTFTANQSGASSITLPQIDFGDLKNVPPAGAAPGNGTITITQPGTEDQSFTVNQNGDTTIALKNDNTQVTPGNGALTIKTAGEGANATGSFSANQSTGGTLTLPTIRYADLSGRPSIPAAAGDGTITIVQPGTTNQTFSVNQAGPTTITLKNDNTVPTVGNGTITIKQPGTDDQSFTVNQTGNTDITLKNDNTVVTPNDGSLTIRTAGEAKTASGTFSANQSDNSTITLPTIRYQDLSGTPSIPAAAGNGTITIRQDGELDQSFTVNQAGNTTISLKNDNTVVTPGDGALTVRTYGSLDRSTGTFTANQSGASALTLPQISFNDLKDVPPAGDAPGNGTITITQPGTAPQSFTVNQSGDTQIDLKNDNTQVTPGNGALTIKTAGENKAASGTFTANQGTGSTITLPTIRYGDLSGRPSIPAAAGNGTITIKQPGTTDQTFTVNQGSNKTITLKNDNTVVTPGNGALTIKTAGENKSASGTFTANQSAGSTITLPTIRYSDLSGRPSIPAAAGNGTITITQPGTTNQTFTVNQSGNTTIALRNDNTVTTPGNGTVRIVQNGNTQSFTVNQGGDATISLTDTNTTYTGGAGIDIVGTEVRIDSSVARVNVNNSFTGRQVFDKQNVTGDIRFTAGATANFFDNSVSGRGGTTLMNYNRVNIQGCVETTAGGAVLAFVNNQQIDMVGGTNTLNVFPSGFKSTPKAYTQWGNFAHFLCQSFGMDGTASVNKVYGYHVCAAAMSGINNNYGLSTAIPEDGNKNYAVYCSGTAPSFFKGNVTSDGTIGFSGRFSVRMEANDPAAYVTTYETEQDEDLNDIQVAKETYIGATEDLATMVKSVRSRLRAIETATTASSESESSALFTLLSDLSSRVAALEAAA